MPSNAYEPHIAALHQSLIPNWTSPAFSKFVEACRNLVDELANSATGSNGKEEMLRCDAIFKQICFLQERFWPEVDGMGEEDETSGGATYLGASNGPVSASTNGNDNDVERAFSGALNGVAEAAAGDTSVSEFLDLESYLNSPESLEPDAFLSLHAAQEPDSHVNSPAPLESQSYISPYASLGSESNLSPGQAGGVLRRSPVLSLNDSYRRQLLYQQSIPSFPPFPSSPDFLSFPNRSRFPNFPE